VLSEGIELAGAGSESTVIDDTAGTTSDLFTNCNNKELTAVIVNNGEGNQIHGLRVNGQTGPNNAVTVLSLSGDLEIYEAVITGGQEGVFVESGTAYLHDLELTGSVHAALKPAGDANVTMERSTVHHNKDAVEPICDSTVTVKDSEIFCNGNGVEALANATTFASGNHIHSNNLGLAARGVTTQLTARGNLIEKNKVGVYEFAGSLDLGTTEDPGLNTLQDNRHIGVLTVVVADDTFAIGNTWQPNVDGTDADGQFSGAVSFSSSEANCPNMPLGNIDTAWDAECESGFSLQSGFQNVAIDNGSCHGENLVEVGDVVVSE